MDATVNSLALADELRLAAKVVANKPAVPILGSVLVRADGGQLILSATDHEVTVTAALAAAVTVGGVAAVPAARLLAIVDRLPDADVRLTADRSSVTVASGAHRSVLQVLAADDFPQLAAPDGASTTLDGRAFASLIARTRYAVAEGESARLLRGALLTLSEAKGAGMMVATDGRRLATATIARTGPDVRLVVPAKALALLDGAALDGPVELTVGAAHAWFRFGARTVATSLLAGEFPKYERIIPRENGLRAAVDRVALAAALRRVALAANDGAVAFAFAPAVNGSPAALTLASRRAEVGSADEAVPVDYDGPPLTVSANGAYVTDFLDAAANQRVTIALKDEKSAILLLDGDAHFGVVAPIRS